MSIFSSTERRASAQFVQESKQSIGREESDFIAISRIVMIIALVFHHVFTLPGSEFYPRNGINPSSAHIADYLNSLIHWVSMAAVPCLSVISGYLFFRRQHRNYFELLHRRITTVVLPSIAWGSFWFFCAFLIYTWGTNNGGFEWIDYDFDNIGPMHYFNGVLGISRLPFAFQFWFVHDLVLTFTLSPVIGWLATRAPWILLIGLGVVWMLRFDLYPFFSTNVLFFFVIGAVSATTRFHLSWTLNFLKPFRWVIGLGFIVLLCGRIFQDYHRILSTYQYLCLLRVAGLLSVILLIGSIALRENFTLHVLRYLSPFSFFIFAFHYPTIEFIRAVIIRIPGYDSEIGMILSFFLLPVSCVAISVGAALCLRWLSPSLFEFVNGGRSFESGKKQRDLAML